MNFALATMQRYSRESNTQCHQKCIHSQHRPAQRICSKDEGGYDGNENLRKKAEIFTGTEIVEYSMNVYVTLQPTQF